jgi:hypothetical protein
LIERVTYLNDSDMSPEKRIGADSRPLRETLAASYELPLGHGLRFDPGNRIVNAVVGGWAANGSIVFQSGPPLNFGNVVYLGGPLNFNPHNPDGPMFDTTRFLTASNLQPSDNIRVFDSQFNNLRRDTTKNADLSMLKRFSLGERKFLQVRFEGFNISNRVTFAAPNLTATSTAFATITAQANTPRRIQMGLPLVW